MRLIHRTLRLVLSLALLLLAASRLPAQQVTLAGMRSLNHAGALHGLKQDAAGNLYTLFDAQDGVRLLEFNATGTQLLAQAQIGQAGDTGIALDVDSAGFVYVAGTSTSTGSVAGTAGTAFPNRADSTTNSFVARFTPALTEQWLTFCGSGRLAVSGIAATATSVYVTGPIFAATLPVTAGGIQQTPAPASVGNGFVESFTAASGTLQYATYLTGANGDTTPAAIAVDSSGNTYIAGATTATGYPTINALLPTFRAPADSNVSGFLTKLDAAGDGFLFSTFVPGSGLASVAVDASGGGSVLVSGNIAPGLFPLMVVQSAFAPSLAYQSAARIALDGSSVISSTLLAPGLESVITPGTSGSAWVFASSQNAAAVPLLPLLPVESLGNATALRVDADGRVDRVARFGGLPTANSSYASLPALATGATVASDGSVALAGSVSPTLSSALLPTETYDLPLTNAPNAALPSTVRDALPLSTCTGSACSGGAALLAKLSPDASAPTLALSMDDLPNLTLRNMGTAAATSLTIDASGYTLSSGCGAALNASDECSLILTGAGPGSVTVQAANAAAFTTQLPATTRTANSIAVVPRELDFGIETATSAASTRTLTVRNLGSTTQTFVSQNTGSFATGYTVAETASTCTPAGDSISKVLAGGGSCTITLGLTASSDPTNDGAVDAHWQVGASDILLTGYAQAAATALSATTVDFGRQFAGGLRPARYLYLSNSSDTPQAHAAVTSTDAAFTVSDECPAAVQPHSVCRMAMGYNSTAAPSSDAVTLTVDAAQVTLLGETLPQPSIDSASTNPNLTLSATSVVFNDAVTVTTVSAETHTITVGNSGAAPFALSLATTGDFTDTTACGAVLAGGATCNVVLSFTPSAAGERDGLLAVTAGSAGPAYIALSGTGTAILPANNGLTFGDVPLNTPSVQWLKVAVPLVSLTAASSDPDFTVILVEDTGFGHGQPPAGNFGSTVTGSCLSCYLGVQFQPKAVGTHTSAVTLTSPGNGKPTTLVVSGNGSPLAGLILTPLAEDFGPVPVHTSTASTVFQLTNATGSDITANSATLTGDFAVTGEVTGGASCSASAGIAAGASCFVPVRFTPQAVGTRTGVLTVTTTYGSVTAALAGTGADDPGIAFTPGELRFDNIPGTSATSQIITLTNTGQVPATIGAASSSDGHFAVSTNCGTLAAGGTCKQTVTYTPADGLSSGTLTIPVTTSPAGAPSTATYAIALSGLYTSESAGIQIIPGEHTAVNFGANPTGSPAGTRILHVNNLTSTALTLTVSAPRQFAVTGSSCGGLAPNAGCDLTVQYTPLSAGDVTGTVFLQGTPSDGSATRNGLGYLEGYGAGNASLAVTGNLSIAGVLAFGQVASGLTAAQTLTLTNPVASPEGTVITVRRVQSEFPFLSTTTCGPPLARGQSCTVTITYSPLFQVSPAADVTVPQLDTGTLTIESDGGNAPQFIDLSGQASAVVVSAPSNTPPLASFTTSQGSLTFANTAVGSASASQSVQLANTGTMTVHVTGLVTSNGFSATNGCGTLAAGATCTIAVTYQPQAAGTTLGSLEIQSDASTSLELVSFYGIGSAASVSLSPQSIDFGRVLVGRDSSQLATLTNTGTTPITVGGIVTTGADFTVAASTTATNPCPGSGGTLASGASCTIAVVFTPSTTSTIRGTLSVPTSATALPLTVALSGVGTQPELTVTPASLAFGNVAVGSSATQSLTLRNTSTVPVDGLSFTVTAGFTVSSTCGITTLNAASSCSVSVTFAPSAIGAVTGTLTIASTDPASPIVVPLSGTAIQGGNFILMVNGASAASVTVQAGLPAAYALSLTPTGGYSGVVALTCTADTPVDYTACSLVPATVMLTTGAQSATATIATVSAVTASMEAPQRAGERGLLLCFPPAVLLLLTLRRRVAALLVLLLAVTLTGAGCGSSADGRIRYAAAGTYNFHVTATSTNGIPASQTVTLTLVVTPR